MSEVQSAIQPKSGLGTPEYLPFGESVNQNFQKYLAKLDLEKLTGVLTVSTEGLSTIYLDSFPGEDKQVHHCNTCFQFIREVGGLVSVNEDGTLTSILWDPETAPDYFKPIALALKTEVESRQIKRFLKLSEQVHLVADDATDGVGSVEKGGFNHLFAKFPDGFRKAVRAKSAEMTNFFASAMRDQFPFAGKTTKTLSHLINIFENSGDAKRGAKHSAIMRRLLDSYLAIDSAKNTRGYRNICWEAIRSNGFDIMHTAGGVIGRLMEEAESGADQRRLISIYNSMVSPDSYMRPDAPPAEGQIKAAEKAIIDMGLASAFARRHALLSEVIDNAIWKPAEVAVEKPAEPTSLFGGLLKESKADELNAGIVVHGNISYVKFVNTVLPKAKKVEYQIRGQILNIGGLLTQANSDAKPLFKHDTEEKRNPFSWFCYLEGLGIEGLLPLARLGETREVLAILPAPIFWDKTPEEIGASDMRLLQLFVLKDTSTTEAHRVSSCLFPELLRSDLYPYRATIEAYSNANKATDPNPDGQRACGVFITKGDSRANTMIVTTEMGRVQYTIDRWD